MKHECKRRVLVSVKGMLNCLKKNFFFNVYFRERETEWEQREGQREGDTESEAGSRPGGVGTEPDVELELTNCEIMTWAGTDSDT